MQVPGTVIGDGAVWVKVCVESGSEDAVSKTISDNLKPKSLQFEEIGFGIKVLKAFFVHDDSTGSSEIEESIRKIPGVNEVEVEQESLI